MKKRERARQDAASAARAPEASIEGQPALSLGFAITAVPATFTP